jgi:hypothetical protein
MSEISNLSLDKPLPLVSSLSQEADLHSSKLPFVWKLYEMLEVVDRTGNQHIVSWVGEGKAFKVHDIKSFVHKIIPMYFRQSKYKSFQRQLYLYEFKRIPSGPHAGSYFHPKFVRGIKTLCLLMSPTNTKRSKFQKKKGPRNDTRVQESISSTEDPLDWMTKKHSLLVHGAGLAGNEDQSKSNYEDNALCEGGVVSIFGGMPFHYVDATHSD